MIGLLSFAIAYAAVVQTESTTESDRMQVATVAVADCYKREIPQLDDGKSGADVIADAVVSACDRPLMELDAAYKKKLVETARSTEGLNRRAQNELATELLQEMPQQLRNKMRNLALTAVLRARANRKTDASN